MKRIVIVAVGLLAIVATGLFAVAWVVACPDPKWVNNRMDPLLFSGLFLQCVDRDQYDQAAVYFALLGMYGRIDASRVIEKSSHHALPMLIMSTVRRVPEAKKETVHASIKSLQDDPVRRGKACATIQKIGPPDYYPDYMINHGIQVFADPNWQAKKQVRNIDIDKEWKVLMDQYLHCSWK